MGCQDYDTPPSTSPSSLISVISSADLSEPEEEPSNKLLVLDSLFPVVGSLPGFTKHQTSGLYYVQGKIDQESLYDFTKRIGELTLGAEPDSKPRLAMHVFVRIARLQDPNKPLFPSLHHLRITHTSKYLDFLDIFLPSALTTIELTAISDDDPYYSSVISFLESAIDQAPSISTLILGPGRIQDQILHISLKYQHLRHLEMRHVGISITDPMLRDIGLLQHLETFILLDDGTSTYIPSEIPAFHIIRQDLEVEAWYVSSPVSPVPSRRKRGFSPELRISECVTPPRLQQDHEPEEALSNRSLSPEPTVSHGHDVAYTGVGSSMFPALRILRVEGSISLIEGLVTEVSPSNLQILSVDFTKLNTKKKRKREVTSKASTSFQFPQAPVTLLRRLIPTWGNTLVSVNLKSDHIATFSLPSDLFENLLLRPDMKRLEITGIGISMADIKFKLRRLEEVVPYSKLEVLHLPVHSDAPSIAFMQLQYIAENCPHLKSLRCRLRGFWEIPVPIPMFHGLEVLSLSNAEVQVELELQRQLLFNIARYLDSVFPKLRIIKTHYEDGNNAEEWGMISDLVKVCQAVRRDECARHGI